MFAAVSAIAYTYNIGTSFGNGRLSVHLGYQTVSNFETTGINPAS